MIQAGANTCSEIHRL